MFKRIAVAALTLALLMSSFIVGAGKAHAQRDTTAAPGVWLSSILIQNTATTTAEVSISFYDKNGTLIKTYPTTPASVLGGKSLTIVVPSQVPDLAPGQYSAVVSSTQKVVASVQTSSVSQNTGPWSAFAYEGVDSTNIGTTLFFPGNYKNYFGFNSELVIQNTSETDSTNLTVDFYRQDGTKIGNTVSLGALTKNSAKTWAMTDALAGIAALPSGSSGLFGAVVKSTGAPIAGIVNIWATSPTNKAASYNGSARGTRTLFAPSLSNDYFGFASALTIQNIDQAADAAGYIEYSNGQRSNFTLKPNAAQEFFQPNNANLPKGDAAGSFSAKVILTSTGGSIIGLVSYSRPANLSNGAVLGDFASYNCPAVASAEVNVPNLLSNYFAYFTNVTVQNTGNLATNITLTYEDGKTWTINNVAPNGVANFIHLNPNGTSIKNPLVGRQSVSATAKSSNGQLLVAVIQHNTTSGVQGYNAAKVPSDYLQVFSATPK